MFCMTTPQIVWLDLQPSLAGFNCRLAKKLSQSRIVKRWSFHHDPDEACTIETVQDYLCESISHSEFNRPHVIAHGTSGTIACMLACEQPKLFRSLTLLSVDSNTANHWTSHYHTIRQQLPCSREQILVHLSSLLFDIKGSKLCHATTKILEKCLDFDFVLSSILSNTSKGYLQKPPIPTMVINGNYDFVVDQNAHSRWKQILQPGDCYHNIDQGRHFFHFHNSDDIAKKINAFLDMIPLDSTYKTGNFDSSPTFKVFS